MSLYKKAHTQKAFVVDWCGVLNTSKKYIRMQYRNESIKINFVDDMQTLSDLSYQRTNWQNQRVVKFSQYVACPTSAILYMVRVNRNKSFRTRSMGVE